MIGLYWDTINNVFIIQIIEIYIWQTCNAILITEIQFLVFTMKVNINFNLNGKWTHKILKLLVYNYDENIVKRNTYLLSLKLILKYKNEHNKYYTFIENLLWSWSCLTFTCQIHTLLFYDFIFFIKRYKKLIYHNRLVYIFKSLPSILFLYFFYTSNSHAPNFTTPLPITNPSLPHSKRKIFVVTITHSSFASSIIFHSDHFNISILPPKSKKKIFSLQWERKGHFKILRIKFSRFSLKHVGEIRTYF